jgi:hypothetical protein
MFLAIKYQLVIHYNQSKRKDVKSEKKIVFFSVSYSTYPSLHTACDIIYFLESRIMLLFLV